MNISEYEYLWDKNKAEYVLVNTEFGYGIVNKKEQTVLSISDDELEEAIIAKMLEEGNKVYENILDVYTDI